MNTSAVDGRTSRYFESQKRRLSMGVDVESAHSSTIPVPIQLYFYPNERHAYQTTKLLFSSRFQNPSNVCDGFGCNVLMYALRYQRYQLFELLLNDIALDLNLRSKDRQGNTILHYAIIYDNDGTKIMEKLIETFQRFGVQIDERNDFGLTPLLLAVFCGRYDVALTLLTKANASPFAREYVQLKNILDFVAIDQEQTTKSIPPHHRSHVNQESVRLRLLLHQVLTVRPATSSCNNQSPVKNFFEHILPEAISDRSGSSRSTIMTMFHSNHSSTNLTEVIHYVNRRYPQINTSRWGQMITNTTNLSGQYDSSKANVHEMIRLFDPAVRSKAIPSKEAARHRTVSHAKTPITFKRLGAKVTVVATFPRSQSNSEIDSFTARTDIK